MHDESIEPFVDDEDEYELLASRRRVGVSPVRKGPFQQPHNFSSRSRNFQNRSLDSLEMSEEEGSPAPDAKPEQPPERKKSLSSKDFTPQQSQENIGPAAVGTPGNLITLASSYAKKLMSGSDKSKEKLPPDVAEATRHDPKKDSKKQQPEPAPPKVPAKGGPQSQPGPRAQVPQQSRSRSNEEEEDDDEDEEDEYDDMHTAQVEGVYNPHDYDQLNVSPEIKELFQYISRYEPPIIGTQMDIKLKPFIPEYYPSVGDIDAFTKVIHPEVPDDFLGIKHLDEPSPFQSDPSVLDLRLRSLAKQSSSKSVVVKKIDNVGKNTKVIENWIKDISDLHRSKPSPSVHYTKPMPDIDSLIQEWPPQLEELLRNISLPAADLDCDLQTYVDIVCNLLDIPVCKSRIQSLHVLFTLYSTYKHFNHYGPLGLGGGGGAPDLENLATSTSMRLDEAGVDRLQIN